jgi:hypothetical protein
MDMAFPSIDEFKELLANELSRIHSPNRFDFIQKILHLPYMSILEWEYGANEPFEAWTFGDLGERDVVLQYCCGGFGALGAPWGINFRNSSDFGMDCGWYPSLEKLLDDWGVEE